MLALHEDGAFRSVAMHNVPQAFAKQRLSGPGSRPRIRSGGWR
jgi:hypothetical protein